MSDLQEKRYIGLDIGNTFSRLSYTKVNSTTGYPDKPFSANFEGKAYLPSIVIFQTGGGKTFTQRSELLNLASQSGKAISFEFGFKHRLGSNDSGAMRATQVMATRLFDEYRSDFGMSQKDVSNLTTAVGIPSDWDLESSAAQALKHAVDQAGFFDIHMIPDAIAAVTYHAYNGDLKILDRAQSWLVVDVGGFNTRLSIVEKDAGFSNLKICLALTINWGGDEIDETIYERILLPNYWCQAQPPDSIQKNILMMLVRDLKEQLSGKVKRNLASAISHFQFDGIQDPVELTQSIFESSEVMLPLISEFRQNIENQSIAIEHDFHNIEQVIIVGGSSNWSFVQQTIQEHWGKERCVIDPEPELTIARGLALVLTGFEPKHESERKDMLLVDPNPILDHDQSTISPLPPPPLISNGYEDRAEKSQATCEKIDNEKKIIVIRSKSRKLIFRCVIAGAIIALLLAPIPCSSFPVLIALELFMFYRVSRLFNYSATSSIFIILVAALLVVSGVLSVVIGLVVEALPGINFVLKPIIAAAVIWGLGEGAIWALEKQTRKDEFRNFESIKK